MKKKPCGCKGLCSHGRIERKTRLERGSGPTRKKRVRPVNPERRAESFARNFGEYADDVRADACYYCGYRGERVQASHTEGRKMGGRGGDRRMLLPMCGNGPDHEGCHARYERHEFDELAARVAALRRYLRRWDPDDEVAKERLTRLTSDDGERA